MKVIRVSIALMLFPAYGIAGVCDTAWDGDKVVTAISGRPAYLRVPLRNKQQQISEVTVGQIQAFNEAKNRISGVAGSSPTFLICGDGDPNAFATKGKSGDIVGVTIGMLKLVDGDVDMAAAVIGHEFAHHTHNHGEVGAGRDALIGIAGLILGMTVDAKSQRRSGVPTNVGQTFGQIGATLVSRKFSRDQEREADATGFQYMVTAGFNPNGAIRLAESMNRRGFSSAGLFFDSHPGWDERGQLFQTLIASNPQAQQIIARSSAPSSATAPASSQAGASTETVALAPTYTTTDAQRSFTAGLAAYRSGDIVNGVREIRSAAEAGYAPAQVAVGSLYREGKGGLPKDGIEAVRLFRLAADQGNGGAQTSLGFAYANGFGGLPKDEVEAVRLYRLAADQGDGQGQTNLAFMYQRGLGGVPTDEVEAVRLYRLAADQGNAAAQAMLGAAYAGGRGGLQKDEVEGVRLVRLAANKGNAIGQAMLGRGFENGGAGLTKDIETAVYWYRLAAMQGQPQAVAALKRLGRESSNLGTVASAEQANRSMAEAKRPGQTQLPQCPGYDTATWTNCVGELAYSSGWKFVGEWRDGNPNGQGIVYGSDGSILQSGTWKNGGFVRGSEPGRLANEKSATGEVVAPKTATETAKQQTVQTVKDMQAAPKSTGTTSVDYLAEAKKSALILGCPTSDVKVTGTENHNILMSAKCGSGAQLLLTCDQSGLCLRR